MTEIIIPNFDDIFIYDNGKLLLLVKRKVSLDSKVTCEYFLDNKYFLKTISYKAIFWRLKIENINSDFKIMEIKNEGFKFFKSKYRIQNNVVTIKDNPFYFINKKMSKIYFNDFLIANVILKNNFGINKKGGFTQIVKFSSTDLGQDIITQSLICYAISCNILNAG